VVADTAYLSARFLALIIKLRFGKVAVFDHALLTAGIAAKLAVNDIFSFQLCLLTAKANIKLGRLLLRRTCKEENRVVITHLYLSASYPEVPHKSMLLRHVSIKLLDQLLISTVVVFEVD